MSYKPTPLSIRDMFIADNRSDLYEGHIERMAVELVHESSASTAMDVIREAKESGRLDPIPVEAPGCSFYHWTAYDIGRLNLEIRALLGEQ